MSRPRRVPVSPATAIAFVALFFALGGSALAVGERLQSVSVAQQRCATGAIRGIAAVTGDPNAGVANIPGQFSSSKKLFRRSFNCTGRATQVRRLSQGVFEVRFVGNAAQSATASGTSDTVAAVEPVGAGTFRVTVHPVGRDDDLDGGFVVVAV